MFRQFCRPVATVEAQGAFLFGWQLSAHVKPAPIRTLADGSDLAYANSFISLLLPAGFLHILRFFSDLE